jgi:hypothetical protein
MSILQKDKRGTIVSQVACTFFILVEKTSMAEMIVTHQVFAIALVEANLEIMDW